jgi:CHASE1-domain containing sensor protein
MFIVAKSLEALGIVIVGLGLILGINSPKLWIELYLGLFGVSIFLIGRVIEKYFVRKRQNKTAKQ